MRIVVISPYPAAPGRDGGSTVIYNIVRSLSTRHQVIFVSFAQPEDRPLLDHLHSFCSDVVTVPFPHTAGTSTFTRLLNLSRRLVHNIVAVATLTPVVVRKCHSAPMDAAIRRVVSTHHPDVVHCIFPQMAHYIEAFGGTPAVMDTSDVALLGVFRRVMSSPNVVAKAYYLMQWLFWVRYQSRYFPRFGKVLTVTRQDAAALNMVLPDLHVYPDAIAVDLQPAPPPERKAANRIGFLGSFGHQPNVDAATFFAEEIFPLIRQARGDAEFVVAGKNPPARLAAREGEGVRCIGFVPDVSAFYGEVDVVVAPIRYGGGIKIKVLEALACGKAVVATSVAAEGITEERDGALLVRDDPASFAAAVVTLMADPARRAELGEGARLLIERRFSWSRLSAELDSIYQQLVRERR